MRPKTICILGDFMYPAVGGIEVHIHHLRRKIHPGVVRTGRGVGYVLGAEAEA